MKYSLKCYFNIIMAYIRSRMVNRWSLLLFLLGIFLVNFATFASIWVILKRFGSIRGWTFGEISLIYIIAAISFGFRNQLFFQFRETGLMIKRGELDQILIRPTNPFIYIMSNKFDLGGFAYIILGITLLFLFRREIGITWTFTNIVFFIIAIISATLVQGAITIFIGTTAFFLEETAGLDAVYNNLRQFIWYPITIFNDVIKFVFLFIIPLAFASFVPAGIFLNNNDYAVFPKWVWQLSLLSGVVLFTISYAYWKMGLKHYQSTGT